MEEENENENQPPRKRSSVKKKKLNKRKRRGSKGGGNVEKGLIQLPLCQHAWCLGEVLKQAGIEPGVCWPRPLPWALTGKLRYLPGWAEECRNYRLQKVYYKVNPKRVNQDSERFAKEVKEAKLLWSYLEPAFLYPRERGYKEPEPGFACDCKEFCCKREALENKMNKDVKQA